MISDYFCLDQDSRLSNIIQLSVPNLSNIRQAISVGDYSLVPESSITIVRAGEYNLYPDVLSGQLFVVKKNIFDVIQLYYPNIKYQTFYIMDCKYHAMIPYYLPNINVVDCTSEENNSQRSTSLKLKRKLVANYDILRVETVTDNVIIVSLAMAESIIRRKPENTSLTQIQLEWEEL